MMCRSLSPDLVGSTTRLIVKHRMGYPAAGCMLIPHLVVTGSFGVQAEPFVSYDFTIPPIG